MAQIAVNPFQLTDCLFQVASDNYEASVSGVIFKPTSKTAKWKGLTPAAVFNFANAAEWQCEISYAQDFETAKALARYLHEHEGEAIAVTFEPKKGGSSITATIVIQPGQIGGNVDEVAASTVTVDVNGKPALEALAP